MTGQRFPNSKVRHGTEAGATTHRNRGEYPCDDCAGAARAASKARMAKPANTRNRNLRSSATHAAYARLREAHPDEFDALHAQEKKARGLL